MATQHITRDSWVVSCANFTFRFSGCLQAMGAVALTLFDVKASKPAFSFLRFSLVCS